MGWFTCRRKRMIKKFTPDKSIIKSIIETAEIKFNDANSLGRNNYYGKISLLYDVLREFLECLSLLKGYKIYYHECYIPFLKEILHESFLGDKFDKLRIL